MPRERDPKKYSSSYLYKWNKHEQDEANRTALGAKHVYKKKVVKPDDDEYVEDIL